MRGLPPFILFAFSILNFIACSEEKKSYVANASNDTPTMATTDVNTFISDSGYTRYHLTSDLWLIYDDTLEPYWRFPTGVELEQYDNFHNVSSTVICDSAIYLARKRIWQLDGNVTMVSTAGDSFLTQQLFWNQESKRILSDSFIHIVRSDRILEGYGFESDQNMTDYIIHHPTAILPAVRPEKKESDSQDSLVQSKSSSTPQRKMQPQAISSESSQIPSRDERRQANRVEFSPQNSSSETPARAITSKKINY